MGNAFALWRHLFDDEGVIGTVIEGDVMAGARLLPVDRFGLIRRATALDADWTDAMLSAAVRAGDLLRPAPR